MKGGGGREEGGVKNSNWQRSRLPDCHLLQENQVDQFFPDKKKRKVNMS